MSNKQGHRSDSTDAAPCRAGQRGTDGVTGVASKQARLPDHVPTGLPALDCVFGGGLYDGTVVLLEGLTGIGKTTLTLQMLDGIEQHSLYVTCEDTLKQVVTKSYRVKAVSNQINLLAEWRVEKILEHARAICAQVLAIDPIRMLSSAHVSGRSGLQLRKCVEHLCYYARTTKTTLWLVGHRRPAMSSRAVMPIEYEADIVLRFDKGLVLDQEVNARFLHCPSKNRFGPTDAVECLELTTEGFAFKRRGIRADWLSRSPTEENLVAMVVARDWPACVVYADWLEKRGDIARAAFMRSLSDDCEIAGHVPFVGLGAFGETWLRAVGWLTEPVVNHP